MYTGIIEAVAQVGSLTDGVLLIHQPETFDDCALGESIAVNGCCLTLVGVGSELRFDLSPETLARTALGRLSPGSHVNLERAMRADGRFGGHVVQGHIDATGKFVSRTPQGNAVVFRFEIPAGAERYLIDKGSIAVDGISLTVVAPRERQFDAWIVPHTIEHTNLGSLNPGDPLNLEFDVLAKYVERMLAVG